MLSLGGVCQRKGQLLAKVDTFDAGTRYYIVGPPRGDDEQQAYQDLCYIRAAAEGASTHVQGLHAMQAAAKLLRDEAKALARGGIKQDAAGSWFARFQYVDAGITKKYILGPPRQGERRAENDLAILREAALGKKTWPEQVAAMQQAAQDLEVLEEQTVAEALDVRGLELEADAAVGAGGRQAGNVGVLQCRGHQAEHPQKRHGSAGRHLPVRCSSHHGTACTCGLGPGGNADNYRTSPSASRH